VGTVKAVDGVSLTIERGEVLGLVGESGCGKSTLARTILQLLPTTAGKVLLSGHLLGDCTGRELIERRRDLQMVFQDPYASLNPRMTVFATLSEPLRDPRRLLQRGGHPACRGFDGACRTRLPFHAEVPA
jgi:oligopeptide transport system ATP-binding protein